MHLFYPPSCGLSVHCRHPRLCPSLSFLQTPAFLCSSECYISSTMWLFLVSCFDSVYFCVSKLFFFPVCPLPVHSSELSTVPLYRKEKLINRGIVGTQAAYLDEDIPSRPSQWSAKTQFCCKRAVSWPQVLSSSSPSELSHEMTDLIDCKHMHAVLWTNYWFYDLKIASVIEEVRVFPQTVSFKESWHAFALQLLCDSAEAASGYLEFTVSLSAEQAGYIYMY